ncbi:MAG TPA: thioredoxin family protein [Thermoplasmata archaeon]|nr:thioredoxin family protein [Thermoplasmata archaeon]
MPTYSMTGEGLKIGQEAPDFELPGVDGKRHRLSDLKGKASAIVVVVSCNHCPYVQAYEDRMIAIQREYHEKGVRFLLVNPNDDAKYEEDSFEGMVARAKMKGYNFPYLRDESQQMAKSYGAVCTPEVFALDRGLKLRYHGNVDDDKDGKNIPRHHLREALDDIIAGKDVRSPESRAFGCSVKWKSTG